MNGTLVSLILMVGAGYLLQFWYHYWQGSFRKEALALGLSGHQTLEELGIEADTGPSTLVAKSGVVLEETLSASTAAYGVVGGLVAHGRFSAEQHNLMRFVTVDLVVVGKIMFTLSVWGLILAMLLGRLDLAVFSDTGTNIATFAALIGILTHVFSVQNSFKKLQEQREVPAEDKKHISFYLTLYLLHEVSKFLTSPIKFKFQ